MFFKYFFEFNYFCILYAQFLIVKIYFYKIIINLLIQENKNY